MGRTSKLRTPPPSVERRRKLAQAARERAKGGRSTGRSNDLLESEHGEAHALAQEAPEVQARIAAKRTQMERMQAARGTAASKARAAKEAGELVFSDFTLFWSPSQRDRAAARYRR